MEAYCTGDTVSVTASTGTAHTYQRNRVVVLSTGFSYVSVDASIVATAAVSSSTPVALVQNSGTGTVMKVTAQRDSSPVNTCAFVDNAEQVLSVGVSTVRVYLHFQPAGINEGYSVGVWLGDMHSSRFQDNHHLNIKSQDSVLQAIHVAGVCVF